MLVHSFRPLPVLHFRPARPVPSEGPAKRDNLEATPVPADAGVKSVDVRQGSLAYTGPIGLRNRLQAANLELIGLRHGESEANAASLLCGQCETPLTDKGKQQAVKAAEQLLAEFGGDEWLAKAAADPSVLPVVYTSPLSRAADTAAALADLVRTRSTELGSPVELPVRQDGRLLEIDLGEYEMKSPTKLAREHPVFASNFDSQRGAGVDFQHRFPQGESRLDVMARVSSLMEDVAVQNPGRKVLLVCHQETLVAVKAALGLCKQRDGRIRSDSQDIQNAVPLHLLPSPRR